MQHTPTLEDVRGRWFIVQTSLNVADPCRFRWRGSAWYIRWVTSDWRIVNYNHAEGWCVVYFSRTLFTAAGVDIYARNKHMSDATITMIKQHMTDPEVRPFVDRLYRPQHD